MLRWHVDASWLTYVGKSHNSQKHGEISSASTLAGRCQSTNDGGEEKITRTTQIIENLLTSIKIRYALSHKNRIFRGGIA